jgi:hypothetical protein
MTRACIADPAHMSIIDLFQLCDNQCNIIYNWKIIIDWQTTILSAHMSWLNAFEPLSGTVRSGSLSFDHKKHETITVSLNVCFPWV